MNYHIIKFKKEEVEIDVRFDLENQTIWLNTKEISVLYGKSRPSISKHIKEIYLEKLLYYDSSCSKIEHEVNGQRHYTNYYNLDLIMLLGNKANPTITNYFSSWVKEQLNNFKNELVMNESNIIRFDNGLVSLDVRVIPEEKTIILTLEQVAKLYNTSKQLISYHANNILKSGEVPRSTVKEILTVQIENGREIRRHLFYYNLRIIIAIGYRINSKKGIEFRNWASDVLERYLKKGYVVNKERAVITEENYMELVKTVFSMNARIIHLEEENKYIFPSSKILLENQMFEGSLFISHLISKSIANITVFDAYVNEETLRLLSNKKAGVTVNIITSDKSSFDQNYIDSFEENGIRLFCKKQLS